MNGRSAIVVLALLVSGACARHPDGPESVYRMQTPDGQPLTSGEALEADVTGVLRRRLESAGYFDWEIQTTSADSTLRLTIDKDLAPQIDDIRRLVERPGALEFRLCVPKALEWRYRGIADEEPLTELKPGHFRLTMASGAGHAYVEMPERAIQAELEGLRARGVSEDAPEFKACKSRHEAAVREVFTGGQIAIAEVVRQSMQTVVAFEFRKDRKAAFADFTRANVGRSLAILLDGKVYSSPVIKGVLPGEGVIEGGGAAGFTEQEAKDFAAVLASGQLPCRLVRVAPEDTK